MDGICRVAGLENNFMGELLLLSTVSGVTLNLEFLLSGLSVLGNDRDVEQGDVVERSHAELIIEVGYFLIGRVIDPVANFIDVR